MDEGMSPQISQENINKEDEREIWEKENIGVLQM